MKRGRIAYLLLCAPAVALILHFWRHWCSGYIWCHGIVFPRGVWLTFLIVMGVATLILAGFLVAGYRIVRKSRMTVVAGIVLTAVTGGGLVFLCWGNGMIEVFSETEGITNPVRYELVRERYIGDNAHFPATVPTHAENVRLGYSRGPLQAGPHLQLRMTLPPDEVATIREKYEPLAVAVARGDDLPVSAAHPPLFYTSTPRAGHKGSAPYFPDSYRILYLWPPESETGTSRHRESYGLAIDESACDVVYWAEKR